MNIYITVPHVLKSGLFLADESGAGSDKIQAALTISTRGVHVYNLAGAETVVFVVVVEAYLCLGR